MDAFFLLLFGSFLSLLFGACAVVMARRARLTRKILRDGAAVRARVTGTEVRVIEHLNDETRGSEKRTFVHLNFTAPDGSQVDFWQDVGSGKQRDIPGAYEIRYLTSAPDGYRVVKASGYARDIGWTVMYFFLAVLLLSGVIAGIVGIVHSGTLG